ncbi:D-alanyl-D-alanine carboxypeptidase family protein [Alkaliphilus sp. B6464]|uniref:D-alanyl-D-alanine carboxypeptidase family protein n=1 Tax=Alkaliphilus sp. B6464 TaxID=2731219 RepID=UPI001BA4898F|nr:D-alanyl-D-alanine carboxypeptidase family protein [Alkaliphilus sp. B6464]QUH20733.1 D-alanyl-D-alanine carboxypeptidase [Alkaliphilus sp. B6464]
MYKRGICIILACIMMTLTLSYGNEDLKNIQIGGESAIVIDVETGRVLYEKNIYKKLPMASTTKIITALLAIENISLDKKVKINTQAEGVEGSSIYLRAGEEVKAIDLIYGLMLRSGNDSAAAIAYEVSGSIEDFAELMNKRAKEIGAKNTNFVNPHGLHDDNHYTTAYDLGLITREALKNPVFREVVKTKFWTADKDGYKHFANKNDILDICDGGDGVKTGYTRRSGRCLVASATRNDMQLIAITFNDYDWFNTTKRLLDESFNIYKPYTLFDEKQIITKARVLDGKKKEVSLKPFKSSIIPMDKEEDKKLLTVIDMPKVLHAPIEKGQRIGKMTTYLYGKIINTTYLVANESIEKQSFKDKIKDFFGIGQ